jgi:hypothetical protein
MLYSCGFQPGFEFIFLANWPVEMTDLLFFEKAQKTLLLWEEWQNSILKMINDIF